MFFPKMKPADLIGQTLGIAADFIGVSMARIGTEVFAGPLFRQNSKVYMLHTEAAPGADSSILKFVELDGTEMIRVMDHVSQIEHLAEGIRLHRKLIEEQRGTIATLESCYEGAAKRSVQYAEDLEELETAHHALSAQSVNLAGKYNELETKYAAAQAIIAEYVALVGELATPNPPNINDEVVAQLSLMMEEQETAGDAPQPPPVVSYGGGEADASSGRGTTGNTIAKAWGPDCPEPFDSDLL